MEVQDHLELYIINDQLYPRRHYMHNYVVMIQITFTKITKYSVS